MGLVFDGADDVVTCSTTTIFPVNGTSVSGSVWILPVSNGGNAAGRIYGQEVTANVGPRWYTSVGITPRITVTGVSDLNSQMTTSLSTTAWNHVCFTWNGTITASSIHIYVNAVEGSYTGNSDGNTLTDNSTATFRIGDRPTGGRTLDAQITELAIWNGYILTSQDILNLSSSRVKGMPLQISPTNLKGYWPMDDGYDGTSADGATVRDISGNAQTGKADNGANNTGMTWKAEAVLSYDFSGIYIDAQTAAAAASTTYQPQRMLMGVGM